MQGYIAQLHVAVFSGLGCIIHQGTSAAARATPMGAQTYIQQLGDVARMTFHINRDIIELYTHLVTSHFTSKPTVAISWSKTPEILRVGGA